MRKQGKPDSSSEFNIVHGIVFVLLSIFLVILFYLATHSEDVTIDVNDVQAETSVEDKPVPHYIGEEPFDDRLNRMVDELEKSGYHCRELQTDTDE